ncbi:hypothetical protein [Gemmatimonas sp.]|uniref:hypothetical protein n=1 Tax=Gemmatimonas sp. TaxID=1962908 RepID=UPI00398362F6
MSQSHLAVVAGIVLVAAVIGRASLSSHRTGADADVPMALVGCPSVLLERDRGAIDRGASAWHDVSAQPELQFALVWNMQFLSHEIVWRNRGSRDLHFRFSADSVGTTAKSVRERVLLAGITETVPGEAIAPGRETGVVCVQLVPSSPSAD